VAALWLYATGFTGAPFASHFSIDPGSALPKAVLLALACRCCSSRGTTSRDTYYTLVLASLYGACLVIPRTVSDAVLGIEIMSLPVYALVLLGLMRAQSTERRSSTWCSAAPPPRPC